jgi:hypothetical protein
MDGIKVKPFQKTTNRRDTEIDLVNITVQDTWIHEISLQDNNDYHLLIGINPNNDKQRYVNEAWRSHAHGTDAL